MKEQENIKQICDILEDIHYNCLQKDFCRNCIFCDDDLKCLFIDMPHQWEIERIKIIEEKSEVI